MCFVDVHKLFDAVAEAEAVASGVDRALPVASYRKAGKPADDGEAQSPYAYDSKKSEADHSHVAGLEDAEELE